MSGGEPILTGREERAAAALKQALRAQSEEWPVQVDAAAWVARVPRRRSIGRRLPIGMAAALVVILAGAVAFAAWPRVVPGRVGGSPSALPSIPGTPGHFNDGGLSFDYPTGWPVLAGGFSSGGVEYVLAVLGNGTWREGCVYTPNSMTCGPDTFNVSPGGILVKVYRWWGGPVVPCRGDVQANATIGNLPVRETVDGIVTTWEIRVPGNEFGQSNNIFVEVHTTSANQLARAEALVASFRWLNSSGSFGCSPAPPTGGPGSTFG
jgi:hypothetical protein